MVQINNHVSITKTEYKLLQYLALSLHPSGSPIQFPPQTDEEWKRLLALADCHEILPLIEDGLEQDNIPEEQRRIIQLKTAKTVHKGIQLQVLNSRLTSLLEKAEIIAVTMKGSAVARFYPVPEYRKTTDLDLFIASANDVGKAVRILRDNGFAPSGKWHANHHIVLVSGKNEVVELHTTWAEAFKEKHLNQYLERCQKESAQHVHLVEWQGLQMYAYETAWQGFYLLIHMLQHFVGSGFGLRNLCDWV
ncbi:MAG: nucleotidyltransferase family protein, partial [Anaerobutyricum hallii]|uniref:nucleotidyltransferase family protein n=1 Tax=Anaerobutyricum hallii TaxID=39488 RepID=UPI002A7EF7F7